MQYMGSKNRIAKELVPIIQSYIDNMENCKGYLEPFVGGANVIDKIKCDNKIGCDVNEYLIALLKFVRDTPNKLPSYVTKEEYQIIKNTKEKFPNWMVGLAGFCTYGAKFFGGYANYNKNTKQDYVKDILRNLIKQSPNLKDVKFKCCDFRDIDKDKIKGYVIYCDPPYRNVTKYKNELFLYEEYYEWVREMSKNNIVVCSEYWMPDDFTCIWQKETITKMNCCERISGDEKNKRIEKLYIYKPNK